MPKLVFKNLRSMSLTSEREKGAGGVVEEADQLWSVPWLMDRTWCGCGRVEAVDGVVEVVVVLRWGGTWGADDEDEVVGVAAAAWSKESTSSCLSCFLCFLPILVFLRASMRKLPLLPEDAPRNRFDC